MEDKSALITVKTEIKEVILENQSTVADRFGVCEEHNYIKNKSDDDYYYYSQLHHSINIKEESDYHETENSYSSEIATNETVSDVQTQENILTATSYCDSRQQIKAENCAFILKTLEKDKARETENFGCSATLLTEQNQFTNIIKKEAPIKCSRKQQIFKKEDFDYELTELHHSINIKEEIQFMEIENAVVEDDYNLDIVRPFLGSQYYPAINNNKHSRNNNNQESKFSKKFKKRGTHLPLSTKRRSMKRRLQHARAVYRERKAQLLREMFLTDMIVDHEEDAIEYEYYYDETGESQIKNNLSNLQIPKEEKCNN